MSSPCSRFILRRRNPATAWFAALAAALLWLDVSARDIAAADLSGLMPMPAEMRAMAGRLSITPAFVVELRGGEDARLSGALTRMLSRWEERSGLTIAHAPRAPGSSASAATFVIECPAPGPSPATQVLGEDESYTLDVSPESAVLRASTTTGALRGLATVQQLLQADASGWFLPAVSISDAPRFPWRGLLIDVCRHWQPMEVIKRNLDGMALVKLNVLHLHLTEDQGFRIESKKYPRLHELGSDGHYFTQEQMRELIAYAAARGIRVVPEFDVPGHATSWVVGYPELASGPGPYEIERRWGVFDPVLDPTNEQVYELLDGFLGEMAALFPDAYVHIGGDENNGKQWNANPRIQAFIQEHNLKDNAGLHAYFNRRVHAILARHGKKLMGWEEILHPDLPADSVVHSWRGADSLVAAARQGYGVVLSKGYYIDLMQTAAEHYATDPSPADSALTTEEQRHILGGEATMWSEWVSMETIDSRIWPRTAAIAERLWSPRSVSDRADMYRRLAIISRRLEEAGLLQEKNQDAMLRRLAGDGVDMDTFAALRTLVAVIDPTPIGQRRRLQRDITQFTPLTGLADCARSDSAAARAFLLAVERHLFANDATDEIVATLSNWRNASETLLASGPVTPRWQEILPVAEALVKASGMGQDALAMLAKHQTPPAAWRAEQFALLDRTKSLPVAVTLPIIPALRLLVSAAAEQDRRPAMTPEEWRRHLYDLVAGPEKNPAAHTQ